MANSEFYQLRIPTSVTHDKTLIFLGVSNVFKTEHVNTFPPVEAFTMLIVVYTFHSPTVPVGAVVGTGLS